MLKPRSHCLGANHGLVLVASRFVQVSPQFDPVFDISPRLFWCASVVFNILIAVSFRTAMDGHGSKAMVLSQHVTFNPG